MTSYLSWILAPDSMAWSWNNFFVYKFIITNIYTELQCKVNYDTLIMESEITIS